MNVSLNDFALKIGVERDKIIEIAKFLGIRKTVLDDEVQQQIIEELNKDGQASRKNPMTKVYKIIDGLKEYLE